ncbi:MAG: hypothetical protein DWH91_05435 [Planctomycetota bacterium]|nr:MAG: hypothetical protein DWH91_05435 [Planctomycetota bacterium]
MAVDFEACATSVSLLARAVESLDGRCREAHLAPLADRNWYALLSRKLLPQLTDQSFLIVAVVGGTNIGKSVVFNHLAGFKASATSPLASGTRHPTVLIPPGFRDTHDLATIFPGFVLRDWAGPEEPLLEAGVDWLFVRECAETPRNLLILDTPDVDSDARVNWARADNIRRSADVLIAVLTQQKYNDAAVKEFFRHASLEEKSILLVFNQCLLPEDEQFWPLWVGTFCGETGIQPQILYLAPNDRRAAESLSLPFLERTWPVDLLPQPPLPDHPDTPRSLMADLTALRFGEIKLRSLSGSLRQLVDRETGVPTWLDEIRQRSSQFQRAAELLTAHKLANVSDWPAVPGTLLVSEIRQWWSTQRKGWTARVHDSYNMLSRAVMAPIRMVRDRVSGESRDPLALYREREWEAVLSTLERVYEKLEWLAELGNELLKPRLTHLLTGVSRAELIQRVRKAHETVALDEELRTLVESEMAAFAEGSPEFFKLFSRLDTLAAAARPAITVILAITGVGLVGDVVLTTAATSTLGHLTADVVGGTVAASVGESMISQGVSQGAGMLQSRLRNLHHRFAARRAAWLAQLLKDHLLGTLPEELQNASLIADSPEFSAARSCVESVTRTVTQLTASSVVQTADNRQ